MRDNARQPATPPTVVSKEDRIKNFILSNCAADTGAELLLVARSPDSPVARAVAAIAADGKSRVALQVIFFVGLASDAGTVSDCDVSMYADAVAVIDAARMMDVHEQLIVGGSAVWFGDSLRREPAKCDAFESFHVSNAEASRNARRAFSQLWSHAAQLTVSRNTPGLSRNSDIIGLAATLDANHVDDGASTISKPN